jgi:DNA polymerase-4
VEDTYETDHVDRRLLEALLERQAGKVTERLRKAKLSGRTVTVKIRLHDFSTHTRSATLPGPTDDARTVARVARTLLGEVDTSGGVRLLGVGVSGLADWIQDDLFADQEGGQQAEEIDLETESVLASLPRRRVWAPGMDVVHETHGHGWVWGSGRGVVTVRFETAETPPGRVLSMPADDPALRPVTPPREV